MTEERNYTGGIIVSVKDAAIDIFSRKELDNLYEATQIIGDTEPRRVFARQYKNSPGMDSFFGFLVKVNSPNVLEVISLTTLGDDQVIAFQPIVGTLGGFLEKNISAVFLPQISDQLTEFSPKFIFILRGVIKGIGYLHSLGFAHVEFSTEGIYLAHDGTARLGLWKQEAEVYHHWEKTAHSKSNDWINLGKLIEEICKGICPYLKDSLKCPKDFQEISDLVCSLLGGSLCCERKTLLHPALWTTKHKRQFFHNARRVLDSKKPHQIVHGWYNHFSPGIQCLPRKYRHYHPHSLNDFHRFGRNVIEHIYDDDAGMGDVRRYFGQDQDSVMRRLQYYYPPLFTDLISIAISKKVLDELVLNETDAVFPFEAVTITSPEIVASTMDLKGKSESWGNKVVDNSLAASSSSVCDFEGTRQSSEGATIFETESNSEPTRTEKSGTEKNSKPERSFEPTSVPGRATQIDSRSNPMGVQGKRTENNLETDSIVDPPGGKRKGTPQKKKTRKPKMKR